MIYFALYSYHPILPISLPSYSHTHYLRFGAAMSYDVATDVYNAFPTIILVTLALVFVLMAFAFNSIVAPIRSVLTLALTLSFVYGLAVLVYQHGAFAFLDLR